MSLFADACIKPLSNCTISALIAKILTRDGLGKILHVGSRDVKSKAAIGELARARFPGYRGTVRLGSVDAIVDGVFRPKQLWFKTEKAAAFFNPMPTVVRELDTIFARSGVLDRLARKQPTRKPFRRFASVGAVDIGHPTYKPGPLPSDRQLSSGSGASNRLCAARHLKTQSSCSSIRQIVSPAA